MYINRGELCPPPPWGEQGLRPKKRGGDRVSARQKGGTWGGNRVSAHQRGGDRVSRTPIYITGPGTILALWRSWGRNSISLSEKRFFLHLSWLVLTLNTVYTLQADHSEREKEIQNQELACKTFSRIVRPIAHPEHFEQVGISAPCGIPFCCKTSFDSEWLFDTNHRD